MKSVSLFVVVSLCAGLAPAFAWADTNSVASGMGRGLAEKYCSGCHKVEPGETAPPPGPPAFQAVADRPTTTPETLRHHLQTTHSSGVIPLSMPNPKLTDDELAKIVSYILSLHSAAPK